MAKVSMAMPSSSANGDETTMTTLVDDDDVDDVYQKQSLRHALPTPGRPWCRYGFMGETTGQYCAQLSKMRERDMGSIVGTDPRDKAEMSGKKTGETHD
jgi:hypothetical protein